MIQRPAKLAWWEHALGMIGIALILALIVFLFGWCVR